LENSITHLNSLDFSRTRFPQSSQQFDKWCYWLGNVADGGIGTPSTKICGRIKSCQMIKSKVTKNIEKRCTDVKLCNLDLSCTFFVFVFVVSLSLSHKQTSFLPPFSHSFSLYLSVSNTHTLTHTRTHIHTHTFSPISLTHFLSTYGFSISKSFYLTFSHLKLYPLLSRPMSHTQVSHSLSLSLSLSLSHTHTVSHILNFFLLTWR